MSRHGERFPTQKAGNSMYHIPRKRITLTSQINGINSTGMISLLERISEVKSTGKELKGALEFLNDWEYFTNCESIVMWFSIYISYLLTEPCSSRRAF
jgi:hypothetical protein